MVPRHRPLVRKAVLEDDAEDEVYRCELAVKDGNKLATVIRYGTIRAFSGRMARGAK